MTDAQEKKLKENLEELAQKLANYVGPLVFEFEAGHCEPWGDAEDGDMYHSEILYGSSYGPAASEILWGDIAPESEDNPDEYEDEVDWSGELCDDLAHMVSDILQERFPDHEYAFAYWDDNCLFVVVSEE